MFGRCSFFLVMLREGRKSCDEDCRARYGSRKRGKVVGAVQDRPNNTDQLGPMTQCGTKATDGMDDVERSA